LLYSTYLGGNGNDDATGIAVAGTRAELVGTASSTNFPLRKADTSSSHGGASDTGVASFDTAQCGDSSLLVSSVLGGTGADVGRSIALDSTGDGPHKTWGLRMLVLEEHQLFPWYIQKKTVEAPSPLLRAIPAPLLI